MAGLEYIYGTKPPPPPLSQMMWLCECFPYEIKSPGVTYNWVGSGIVKLCNSEQQSICNVIQLQDNAIFIMANINCAS